ncbi:hypothetical protein [Natronobacterium gregoryi]|uniref:Uncharacterized protein n=2 Tax=Natronobacterium gregoryi TaxID=44930 RepID=L0AE36_NATGS|nr:hypothetical protein [Natronobacterium gregoryi]AFZ72163.1 hypothetical protein Natgr_0928 [Natronobacterium gregoryi SP2]ELY63064.1 hypothetical protein C490_16626 [Natronobacterium gregoryi SP2]PLK20108.1 hypothetical protein CYV19_11165 [Natronobacterium gregoryi SP2]SFJ33134.1 hypothetical protein SAMN05443661_12244 [Natronobacterium gregoryi]
MEDDRDVTAVRIAVRQELNHFFRRLVSLLLATLGTLFGLAAMVSPFVLGGGEFLFASGLLVATLCSWWFLGSTTDLGLEELTEELDEPTGSNDSSDSGDGGNSGETTGTE